MKIIHKASPFWSATRLDVTFYNFVENGQQDGFCTHLQLVQFLNLSNIYRVHKSWKTLAFERFALHTHNVKTFVINSIMPYLQLLLTRIEFKTRAFMSSTTAKDKETYSCIQRSGRTSLQLVLWLFFHKPCRYHQEQHPKSLWLRKWNTQSTLKSDKLKYFQVPSIQENKRYSWSN